MTHGTGGDGGPGGYGAEAGKDAHGDDARHAPGAPRAPDTPDAHGRPRPGRSPDHRPTGDRPVPEHPGADPGGRPGRDRTPHTAPAPDLGAEPARRPRTHDPKHLHAGNGTVNDGLDDQSPGGLDSDELALRRMLHHAVQEIEPRDGVLEHLQRAVPARRARKRQAAVGLAATALFLGTAVPALLHVSRATGTDAAPSVAGSSSQVQGGTGEGRTSDGHENTTGSVSGPVTGEEQGGSRDTGRGKGAGAGASASPDPGPAATGPAEPPRCTADRLGGAKASADGPDSAGIVYGTFHLVNVSDTKCVVGGAGSMTLLAKGAADPSRITVVQHTAGDAAPGLPDPSLSLSELVLAPGSAFDVRFAWVPAETCPTTGGGGDGGAGDGGGTGTPSPAPSPSPATTGIATGGSTGTTTQMVAENGTDGGVVVSYTPATGTASVTVTVPHACAGTVYRTGLLPQ
ncbi:hypothetical protein [Streptomyces sp. MUM 2J]|uniref:hypothetical protein n=1 Tax=Streptomyces sp. MUM 2J TaxID=2791987 RepID=UPI001F03513F|nr:hypothetical protein [Streptomyces sp. MUM 2J]